MRFPIIGLLVAFGLLTSGFFFIDGLGNLSLGSWFIPLLIAVCMVFVLVAMASMKDY